jgi:hypothetical protein
MAGITLAQAEAQLASWLAASTAVAGNQSYEISGRKLTRANAAEIQKMVDYWNGQVIRLSRTNSGARVRTVAPGG